MAVVILITQQVIEEVTASCFPLQLLEGALAATKAKMEQIEEEKDELEARVGRMTADLEDGNAATRSLQTELEAQVSALSQQLQTSRKGATDSAALEPTALEDLKAELAAFQVRLQVSQAPANVITLVADSENGNTKSRRQMHTIIGSCACLSLEPKIWRRAPQEASKAREADLEAEIERLTAAAAAREAEVRQKLSGTQAQLDALLPQLEESSRSLAESASQGTQRVEEMGAS